MRSKHQRSSVETSHRLLAEIGLVSVIEEQPSVLFVADGTGTIGYRNKAAVTAIQRLQAERGQHAAEALRESLREIVRTVRSYPHSRMIEVGSDSHYAAAELTVVALPNSYLCTWRDVTVEREQQRTVRETAERLDETSGSFQALSGKLADDTDEVTSRAEAVAAGAEEFESSIREISASAAAAVGDTTTAAGAASAATTRITKLGESSAQVESVSRMINSIAEQTNLLALNATIEAARAGEAGKGFAVVAGEVKELAGRTSEATDQIAATIQAIKSDSDSVAASIAQIAEMINKIEAAQTTIASAVEQQTATAGEMSASISTVATAMHSSAQILKDLNDTADQMSAMSRVLREHA